MREEGNVIILNKGECYYSSYDNERYWLLSGSAQLFIVPWFDADKTLDREFGRAVRLKEFTAENAVEIPALYYKDSASGNSWRFCLKATAEETRIEIRTGVSRILKKNFLREAGINSYEAEGGSAGGFENSLIAYYNGHLVKERVFIHQDQKNDEEVRKGTLQTLEGGIQQNAPMQEAHGSMLYKTVHYAAVKCGIDHVEEEERIIRACSGKTVTVPDIARASHFICREVTLDMDWYKNDCGIMIAFLPVKAGKDAKGRDKIEKHPVVCYLKGSKYRCYDGQTETDQPLTKAIADTLEPKAYSIRRTLPGKALNKKDIVSFVRKGIHTRDIVHLIILSVLTTLVGVLLPKLNQLIYDDYIPMGDTNVIMQICMVIGCCMIGSIFITVTKTLQEYRIPGRSGYELQDAVYHRLFELPENFFRDYDSAELANRAASVGGIANKILSLIFSNGFTLVISVIYWIQMIRHSWKLSLAGFLMLLVYGAVMYFLSRHALVYLRKIEEYKGRADGKLYQFLAGVDKLRMAGAEERAELDYSTTVANEKRLALRVGRNASFLAVLSSSGSTIFSMVLYYMMINSNLNVSMGSFMAFTTAFGSVTSAALGFVSAAVEYSQLKPVMKRVNPILQTATEDDEGKDIVTALSGAIDVDNVVFSYAEGMPPVLNGLSLHVNPGEYVAIVGQSGCGKSTLLKLLLGFETPRKGRIRYDGKDITALNRHSLRKKLGVVLQNGKLIAGSIFENITITSSAPELKKVWQTIDDVGLREDIESMPMGIHTMLSESAGTISGGQMQRILIARAIYTDPAVLFFDEATSALDNITQARVCESLEKRHMTRLVIAHRLSTVRNCDRILVLDQGKVAEEGTYDQLMKMKGLFYQMAERQLVSPEEGN